jgi:acetyl-CoA carboxylase biotin carboxyl carrier protein
VESPQSPPVLADVEATAARLWADLAPAPTAVTVRHGDIEVRLEASAVLAAVPPAAGAPAAVTLAAGAATAPAGNGAAPAVAGGLAGPPLPGVPPAGTAPAAAHVRAPLVGVFYQAPAPGERPFVAVGDHVKVGQQVGLIEAMKMMVPVESEVAGRITEILVADGEAVEYDRPLVAVAHD